MSSPHNRGDTNGADEEQTEASEGMGATNRRRVLQTGGVALAASAGCIAGEFPPESPGSPPSMPPGSDRNAKQDLRRWASIEAADGEAGRPLPVTGSWNIGRFYNSGYEISADAPFPEAWGPTSLTEMVESGHHVLPTFFDPMARPNLESDPEAVDLEAVSESFGGTSGGWKGKELIQPALDYCAEHGLPIAFRDWNWAANVAKHRSDLPTDETARFIKNGEKTNNASPIAPVERWREFGEFWLGHPTMQAIQDVYPDPPLVVFLDNNEAGNIGAGAISTEADRFVEEFGEDTVANMSGERKAEIIHEGYRERYQAMFEAAREVAPEGWQDDLKFVAYNAFPWPKPRGENQMLAIDDVANAPDQFPEWSYFDGAMPENYMNDWQVGRGKTDFSPWSPQQEATSYAPMAEQVFEEAPEYYYANIGWDGGHTPKRFYATGRYGEGAVRRWDFGRYLGMLQFGLWASRPRSFREFRGGGTRDAYNRETWQLYLDMVDRVWDRDDLHEFWKHGELVEVPVKWKAGNNFDLNRWYILECDANPPASEWPQMWQFGRSQPPKLRVFALALRVGEAPDRRWLVYAHAPLGAVSDATITVPEYGDVTVDVSRTGSFYVIEETGDGPTAAYWGGPPELSVSVDPAEHVDPGTEITAEVDLVASPDTSVTDYEWTLGSVETRNTDDPASQSVTLPAGRHTIAVTAVTEGDVRVTGESTVWAGQPPAQTLLYDVSLDRASDWAGPWKAIGEEWPGELQEYRFVPNRGTAIDLLLVGGSFVEDGEAGRVLDMNGTSLIGEPGSLITDSNGNLHAPSKTGAVRFKTSDLSGRFNLYHECHANSGYNIYVKDGTLWAGGWGVKEKHGGWNGDWISADGVINTDTWHKVALVVEDVEHTTLREGAMQLYVDGEQVASGPAMRLGAHNQAPKFGSRANTRYHDGRFDADGVSQRSFSGLLADAYIANEATLPD
jgi:hypothetical protein